MKYSIVLLFCVLIFAEGAKAERREIEITLQKEGESVAKIGKLHGHLQVQADSSRIDSRKKTAFLSGNVVITAKDRNNRVMTLRAAEATIPLKDTEFQVKDKVYDPDMGWFDQLELYGNTAGVREAALRRALEKHPGFDAYRLRSSGVGAGAGYSDVVVYNVREGRLKHYGNFRYPEAGIFEITDMVFSNVSLQKIAVVTKIQQKKGRFIEPNFKRLRELGCPAIDKSRRIPLPPN